jgi:hypothetical protein
VKDGLLAVNRRTAQDRHNFSHALSSFGKSLLIGSSTVRGGADSGRLGEIERVHRQLIDSIRQKDVDAFIDAIESNNVNVSVLLFSAESHFNMHRLTTLTMSDRRC